MEREKKSYSPHKSRSKEKHHKRRSHRRSRERSGSRHRSRDRGSSRKTQDKFNKKLEKMGEETVKKKIDRETSDTQAASNEKKYRVNNLMLSLMVKDNIRNNRKMDEVLLFQT